MRTKYAYCLMDLTALSLSIGQMIVLTNIFVRYKQFDLDIILKVTAANYHLNVANWKCSTDLPKASNQSVLGVLLFASIGSTNMGWPRSLWPTCRSPEVKMSLIGIHVNMVISSWQFYMARLSESIYIVDTLGEWLLPIFKLGYSDLLCGFYQAKFTFPMYSNGNKICLSFNVFWQQCLFQ